MIFLWNVIVYVNVFLGINNDILYVFKFSVYFFFKDFNKMK